MKAQLTTSLVCVAVASLVAASPARACERDQEATAKTAASKPVASKASPKAARVAPPLRGYAPATPPAKTAGQAGLVVVRDAETGLLRAPEGQELQVLEGQMRSMFSDSAEGLEEYPLPGGGFGMNLDGRFQTAAVARVGANGKVEWICADTAKQAATFMKAKPVSAPAAPAEVK